MAVLSDKMLAGTTFRRDLNILRKSVVTLDAKPFTVIGVMPPDFNFPPQTELWIPAFISPAVYGDYEHRYIRVVGRLQAWRLCRRRPDSDECAGASDWLPNILKRMLAMRRGSSRCGTNSWAILRMPLLALSGAVALGAVHRLREYCQFAAGARCQPARRGFRASGDWSRAASPSPTVLHREFVSFTRLGVQLELPWRCGAARFLLAIFPNGGSQLEYSESRRHSHQYGPVLWFALAITLLTGLLFGGIPALQSGLQGNDALKQSSRGLTSNSRSARLRRALSPAEIALALILLIGGGTDG